MLQKRQENHMSFFVSAVDVWRLVSGPLGEKESQIWEGGISDELSQ